MTGAPSDVDDKQIKELEEYQNELKSFGFESTFLQGKELEQEIKSPLSSDPSFFDIHHVSVISENLGKVFNPVFNIDTNILS